MSKSKYKVGDWVKTPYTEGMVTGYDEEGDCLVSGCVNHGWWDSNLSLVKPAEEIGTHYTPDASGKDYLARCEETYSREEMIGAYRFTIGKYVDRMGKKQGEPVEKELDKIIDYATRAKQWLGRQS